MTNINIKFDDALFSSKEKFETSIKQGKKIGFYQEANHYIFSSTLVTSKPLVTDLSKIVNTLNSNPFSEHSLSEYDLKKTNKILHFYECIQKIIEKRNERIEKIKSSKFIKFLLTIPLINRIVNWCLQKISLPINSLRTILLNAAQKVFLQLKIPLSSKFPTYIAKINHLNTINEEMQFLKKLHRVDKLNQSRLEILEKHVQGVNSNDSNSRREILLEMIRQAREDYKGNYVEDQNSWNNAEIWTVVELKVQNAFTQRIVPLDEPVKEKEKGLETSPSVSVVQETIKPQLGSETPLMVRVRKILAAENASHDTIFSEVLGIELATSFEEAEKAFENTNAFLNSHSEEFQNDVSKALNLVKQAYFSWMISKSDSLTLDKIVKEFFNKNTFTELKEDEKKLQSWVMKLSQVHKGSEAVLDALNVRIETAFEMRLREVYPSLAEAERIIECNSKISESRFDKIHNINPRYSLEEILERSKAELSLPQDLPQELREKISKANDIKRTSLISWLAERINRLCKNESTTLEVVFGTDDKTRFFERYKAFLSIFQGDKTSSNVKEAVDALTRFYGLRLKESMGVLGMNPNRTHDFFKIFSNEASLKALKEERSAYLLACEEYNRFQAIQSKPEPLISIDEIRGALDYYLDKEMKLRLKNYRIAFDPLPKDRAGFQQALNIYNDWASSIQSEDILDFVKNKVEAAHNSLITAYYNLEWNDYAKRLKSLDTEGTLASLGKFFTSTSTATLNLFNKSLGDIKILLGLDTNSEDSLIKKTYKDLHAILSTQKEKNSIGHLEKTYSLYESYLNLANVFPGFLNDNKVQLSVNHILTERGVQSWSYSVEGHLNFAIAKEQPEIRSVIEAIDVTLSKTVGADPITKNLVTKLNELRTHIENKWKGGLEKQGVDIKALFANTPL